MQEREIDLIVLFYDIIKRWRSILAISLILMIGAGVFGAVRSSTSNDAQVAYEQALAEYETASEAYEEQEEALIKAVDECEKRLNDQKELSEDSLYYRIDPLNENIAAVSFSVTADSDSDAMTIVKIILDYCTYGGIATKLRDDVYKDADITFINELVARDSAIPACAFTYRVLCASADEAQKVIKCVTDTVTGKSGELKSLYPDHKVNVVSSTVYSVYDRDLESKLASLEKNLVTYETDVEKAVEALDTFRATPVEKPVLEQTSAVKHAIKYGLLAFIAGAVIMFFIYAVKFAFTKKVYGDDFYKAAGISLIGTVCLPERKRSFACIDRLIDRIFGRKNRPSYEQSIEYTVAKLERMSGNNSDEIFLIGSFNKYDSQELVTELVKASKVKVTCLDDILNDSDNVRRLSEGAKVLILVREYDTKVEQVIREKELLAMCKAELIGAVSIR